MEPVFEVIKLAVLLFMEVLGYAMLIRAVLSIFGSEESKLMVVCYAVSEPVVAPVRNMLDRVPGIRDIGIDFSFMATYLLLEIVRLLLLSFA